MELGKKVVKNVILAIDLLQKSCIVAEESEEYEDGSIQLNSPSSTSSPSSSSSSSQAQLQRK